MRQLADGVRLARVDDHFYMSGSFHPPSKAPRLPTLTVPVALTSFVGREREIAQLKHMLTTARLVTLTGAGGSGKSRLALQVATRLTEAAVFQDGVCWVELVSLANPDLVPQSIASALTLREVPHESFLKTIANDLRAKQLLLVLDNCEHLINACAHIANDLLTRCPRLKILATSRERLGISAERVFPVPLLSLPDSQPILDTDQVAQSDAIRLYVERAQAVKPEFSLTNQNVAAIVQVCRRLDGIPLAIELAATRVRVLAVEQIAARLEDRFSLLTADSRAALPRHQTLRATLDWSNDLLTAFEKILFKRFAIFAGGWTLEAAEAVCSGGAIQSGEVLDLISRLVDKSLVIVQEQEGVARYHYLDTIRAYAYEKLQTSEELKQIQERHFDFFLGLAQQTETARFFSPPGPWLNRYSLENDNFRAALDSSIAEPNAQKALQLAGALIWVWSVQSYWSEGLEWLRRALALGTRVSPPGWGTTLLSATYLNGEGGDYQQAIAFGEQSLALYRGNGDPLRLSDALGALGSALSLQGEVERAIPILEESLGLYREQGNELCVAECLNILADSLQRQGDPESSIPPVEESLSIARRLEDEYGIQRSLAILAGAYRMRGDFTQATLFYNQAMTIRVKNNYIIFYPWAFEFYAILAVSQMQPERAARLWGAAHKLREASGWRLPPAHRHYLNYERDTLNQLGSETFARLVAEGGATPVEKMLEYAVAAPVPAHGSSTNQLLSAASKPNFGGLTVREREIARLIAEGKTNREIADQLVLSTRTVENHVGNILGKLGFHSRTQVAMWAAEQGLYKN